jgi:thiamine biosynthesis lipoprotein
MGSEVHVIVVGHDAAALTHRARLRVADLEGRWSRFRADSELSMLNTGAGRPVPVSAETRTLVACAAAGWRRSGGRFDPTVLPALLAAGYDRDYPALTDAAERSAPTGGRTPGCGGVVVDDRAGTVTLPAGAAFDPGGIGKGLAADLVTAELLGAGAQGVCVNLGGDLVARGTSPHRAGWGVAVDDRLLPPAPTLLLADGAVATSSVLHRTWVRGGERRHHLIDPRSGRSAFTALVAVTAIAATGWEAEVAAKTALLAGTPVAASGALLEFGAAGLLFDRQGRVHGAGGVEVFVAPDGPEVMVS